MSLLETQLPVGWSWETISNRYRITKKPRERVYSDFETIPFVPMESVPVNGREAVRFELRHPNEIASGTYFEKGDVLLSKITPSFENGKQGLANNIPAPFGVASTEIIPLQAVTPEASHRFLFFYLLHPEVRSMLAGKMEGSTGRQRVPEHAVRDFSIPMPPKPEQEKIAAVLWKIQRAVEVEEKLVAAARELKQSAMRQLFTRGLRNERQKETEIGPVPETWQLKRIRDLGAVVTGTTPPTAKREYYDGGAISFIAPGDLGAETFIHTTGKKITEAGLKVSRQLPKHTVCFVCIGSTIGKVGITVDDRSATNQQINSIIVNPENDPLFVGYLLEFKSEYVASFSSPSPVPIMSKGIFENVALYVTTDKNEQREIAGILETLDRKISVHERKRGALGDLFQTLLHQLMTAQIRVHRLDIDTREVKAA